MHKCPVTGCNYVINNILTNHHCETAHGLTRAHVIKKYGEPKKLSLNYKAREENLKMHKYALSSRFNV